MSRSEWEKKKGDFPPYEGPRGVDIEEMASFGFETEAKIKILLDSMEWSLLVVFSYDGSDRVVAPFVVGVSSDRNPLLRGYQLEGISRSGKGEGWRVFQINKISNLENFMEYFDPGQFDFDGFYPWIYRVYKML